TIEFEIFDSKYVNLDIYDFSGNKVKSLINRNYSKGKYTVNWNAYNEAGNRVANGMYFYILKGDNQQISKKMIVIK
ncbi:MAG: FlgD immunoglobulin-like domain containing protein, partial [Bacteroidales bacterium]